MFIVAASGNDWVNQVVLYNQTQGILTEHQQIIAALLRLRAPATKYMQAWYDKVREGEDLGSFKTFIGELTAIYGKRDNVEGAKTELSTLWANKTLASKDFIKYAEQYRTLARISGYQDNVLIDKLRDVIPQELKNALVGLEVHEGLPKLWEPYLELLLKAYKAMHPEKAKSVIFGNGNNSSKSATTSDPDAMEIDSAKKNKNKGKAKEANSQEVKRKHCVICSGKGFKTKATSHNTSDCYDKPGNEHKKPAPRNSSSTPSSFNGQGKKEGKGAPGVKKTFKAQLMELLEKIDDDDSPAPPAAAVNINTARIVEISES